MQYASLTQGAWTPCFILPGYALYMMYCICITISLFHPANRVQKTKNRPKATRETDSPTPHFAPKLSNCACAVVRCFGGRSIAVSLCDLHATRVFNLWQFLSERISE